MFQRTVRRIFTDNDDLPVVFVSFNNRENVWMSACLYPELRFLFDKRRVKLVVERKFYGDLRGGKFSTIFRQPNFAECSASESSDKRVRSDLFGFSKHG